jgi:hypothetical protein
MRVGPGETHEMQVLFLDPALEFLGLPSLFVGPQAVLFDESQGLAHLIFRV